MVKCMVRRAIYPNKSLPQRHWLYFGGMLMLNGKKCPDNVQSS